MSEIIRINNAPYNKYEELLLRKSALRKECFQLEQEYTRVFGEDILTLFRLQIECAKKKKTIEFCQKAVNRGEEPDEHDLQEFILQETLELREHFQKLSDDYEFAKNTGEITEAELTKIRRIYRTQAKLLHTDLHPEVAESEELRELWYRVSTAYACNDLKELEELEVLVAAALAANSGDQRKIDIPDIEEKIRALEEEITKIMDTDPYQYKFMLNDPVAVQEKKDALRCQMDNFREYAEKLDQILSEVLPEGMIVIWDTV